MIKAWGGSWLMSAKSDEWPLAWAGVPEEAAAANKRLGRNIRLVERRDKEIAMLTSGKFRGRYPGIRNFKNYS